LVQVQVLPITVTVTVKVEASRKFKIAAIIGAILHPALKFSHVRGTVAVTARITVTVSVPETVTVRLGATSLRRPTPPGGQTVTAPRRSDLLSRLRLKPWHWRRARIQVFGEIMWLKT
jgi:hypothetical protein